MIRAGTCLMQCDMRGTHHIMARAALLLLLAVLAAPVDAETLSHGMFKNVTIYRAGGGNVKHFVLFVSGAGGWGAQADRMARALSGAGALVAGIDDRSMVAQLEADPGRCVSPVGDLENLSHYVQAYAHVPTYLTPVLAGQGAGATLAYAVAAQAPKDLFAGVLTIHFDPRLALTKPLCPGESLHVRRARDRRHLLIQPSPSLGVPWVSVDAQRAQRDAAVLAKALARMTTPATPRLPPPPASLADLPLIELPATASPAPGAEGLFAVLLSGDGGWAGIDKELGRALAQQGIAVAGLDSLRYFWSARTPSGLAADLDRIVRYYAARWHRPRALLIGYSQGADVLPFGVNRLSAPVRASLALTALIGLGRTAAFEFHVANWLGDESGLPVAPEVARLTSRDTVCLYGKEDADSVCPQLDPAHARIIELPGGHHFGGDYLGLARLILEQAGVRPLSTQPQAASAG